jgi:hypothetical protein
MKPLARRITLAAAVLGAGIFAVFVVLNWGTVRDHTGAWWFQLTSKTEMLVPWEGKLGKEKMGNDMLLLIVLASSPSP